MKEFASRLTSHTSRFSQGFRSIRPRIHGSFACYAATSGSMSVADSFGNTSSPTARIDRSNAKLVACTVMVYAFISHRGAKPPIYGGDHG